MVEEIRASKLPPNVLCFELTETATIGNLEKAQHFLRTLQDLGCQFALDDFGTGVSSLAYLKDLSVNYLKIDGSFVRDSLNNTRSESMIKAIAQLAKVMCMETIAEYVETDQLRARMADLGVDYGQGFAMGKAQPLEDLLARTGDLRGHRQHLGGDGRHCRSSDSANDRVDRHPLSRDRGRIRAEAAARRARLSSKFLHALGRNRPWCRGAGMAAMNASSRNPRPAPC